MNRHALNTLTISFFCVIFSVGFAAKSSKFSIKHQWTKLEFAYNSMEERQNDIDSKIFIPGVPTPIDVAVSDSYINEKQIFVTMPRWQPGIPATFGIVTDQKFEGNPIIKPYPSWDWHRNPERCNQNRLVSVFRVFIDQCQRLWVLDTGRLLDHLICPPQLIAFDLSTDKVLTKIEIPASLVEPNSILVTPIVDTKRVLGKCISTFVYVADCQTSSIIVVDIQKMTSWKFTHESMKADVNFETYNIAGDSFELMDDVLGMDVSPPSDRRHRKLYYHAMSSDTENWVYTKHLKNRSLTSSSSIFNTYKGHRYSQTGPEAIDKNGIMFFGLFTNVTINCWNIKTEYGLDNFDTIEDNPVISQFPSGVKIVTDRDGDEILYVLTSRYQKVAAGTIDSSDVNFRILEAKIKDLVLGTKCDFH